MSSCYEKEILDAHDLKANQNSLKQAYNFLVKAGEDKDTRAIIIAADWLNEVAQRIKLAAKIRARTEQIEKYAK